MTSLAARHEARDPSLRQAAARLASLSLGFALLYWLSNRLTSIRNDIGDGVFEWERAIPFVEWTIVPYLSICAFFVLSFFIDRDAAELDRHVRRLWLALLISVACYAAFPLRFAFERPLTTGLTGLLFSALSAFDQPYNRAPSLHISVLLILWVRFAGHVTGWRLAALGAWFALIGVSVLTTYQHHVIDVPAGLALGGLCIAFSHSRLPRLAAAPDSPGVPGGAAYLKP
jgi:hypothetical protein